MNHIPPALKTAALNLALLIATMSSHAANPPTSLLASDALCAPRPAGAHALADAALLAMAPMDAYPVLALMVSVPPDDPGIKRVHPAQQRFITARYFVLKPSEVVELNTLSGVATHSIDTTMDAPALNLLMRRLASNASASAQAAALGARSFQAFIVPARILGVHPETAKLIKDHSTKVGMWTYALQASLDQRLLHAFNSKIDVCAVEPLIQLIIEESLANVNTPFKARRLAQPYTPEGSTQTIQTVQDLVLDYQKRYYKAFDEKKRSFLAAAIAANHHIKMDMFDKTHRYPPGTFVTDDRFVNISGQTPPEKRYQFAHRYYLKPRFSNPGVLPDHKSETPTSVAAISEITEQMRIHLLMLNHKNI